MSAQTRLVVDGDPEKALPVFICRRCGFRSRAKARPTSHHPKVEIREGVWAPVICGPFDRYLAVHDDPRPRPELERAGEPIGPEEPALDLDDRNPDHRDDAIPF